MKYVLIIFAVFVLVYNSYCITAVSKNNGLTENKITKEEIYIESYSERKIITLDGREIDTKNIPVYLKTDKDSIEKAEIYIKNGKIIFIYLR